MKLEKKDKVYIFFIALLSALFLGLFFLTISGWFYNDNKKSETYLEVGSSAVIEMNGTETNVLSYNFDGAVLSGEEIKQNVSIKNAGEDDLFIRAKLLLFSSNHEQINVFFKTNFIWTLNADGYYYFEDRLESLGTIALSSGLIFSNEEQLASKADYILTIVVEGLSTKYDRIEVWGN